MDFRHARDKALETGPQIASLLDFVWLRALIMR